MMTFINDPIAKILGEWSTTLNVASVSLRLVVALIFAAIIGWDRSRKRHFAGLRTFVLATFSCTIAMLLDQYILQSSKLGIPVLSAATIIGVAMLSGNSVSRTSDSRIRGLTTSTGLLACGIMGLTSGAGFYLGSLVALIALVCILSYMTLLEGYLKNHSSYFKIHLELTGRNYLRNFSTTLRELGIRIDEIEYDNAFIGSGLSVYYMALKITGPELRQYKTHVEIIEALSTLDYVYHIEEI